MHGPDIANLLLYKYRYAQEAKTLTTESKKNSSTLGMTESYVGSAGSAGKLSGETGSEIAWLIAALYFSSTHSYSTAISYIGPYGTVSATVKQLLVDGKPEVVL